MSKSAISITQHVVVLTWFSLGLLLSVFPPSEAANVTYKDNKAVLDFLLDQNRYSKHVRPVLNQADPLQVMAYLELISITEVDDVRQSFVANGFFFLWWVDEMLRWNSSEYNGVKTITAPGFDIFRPQLFLLNTLETREKEELESDLVVHSSGLVIWSRGEVFTTSCQLDLTKFPFDEQKCTVELINIHYTPQELSFITSSHGIYNSYFVENREWDILEPMMSSGSLTVQGSSEYPSVKMSFHLRRKPVFMVLTVLIPIILISLLNILVFIIPVNSGEKVSYGITVLLALAVYMSIASDELPRSSKPMPLIISYILILLTISMLSVLESIVVIALHHLDEAENPLTNTDSTNQLSKYTTSTTIWTAHRTLPAMDSGDTKTNLSNLSNRSNDNNNSSSLATYGSAGQNDIEATSPMIEDQSPRGRSVDGGVKVQGDKYKTIGKYVDRVSLIVFGSVWLAVNVGFIVAMSV